MSPFYGALSFNLHTSDRELRCNLDKRYKIKDINFPPIESYGNEGVKSTRNFVKKDWLRNQKAKKFIIPPLAREVDFLYLCVWKYFQENAH